MTTQANRVFRAVEPLPQPPEGFMGSWPEFVCYREIRNQGYVPNLDFNFQSNFLGGRLELGGIVVDFVFHRPPGLAIEVNGRYYHYDRPSSGQDARDIYKRAQMAGLGYTLIFIDDLSLLTDPSYYVSEALQYRDHSELSI